MACRSARTSWRSSLAVIRSTEAEIPTLGNEQILREAGKSLRETCEDDWIMRPFWRAGQAMRESEDGPFMTDVAARQHSQCR